MPWQWVKLGISFPGEIWDALPGKVREMSICVQKSDKSSECFSSTTFEEVSSVASALGIYAILRSELIVKSEMVDDEVDYRQPDEDQLSLVVVIDEVLY